MIYELYFSRVLLNGRVWIYCNIRYIGDFVILKDVIELDYLEINYVFIFKKD